MYATYRKATNPAFGYLVRILGRMYGQQPTKADANAYCEKINAACMDMTPSQVVARYKLGSAS